MKSRFGVFLLLFMVFSNGVKADSQQQTIRIAVVSDGKSGWGDQVFSALKNELAEFGGVDFDFQFPPSAQFDGAWSLARASRSLTAALNNPDIDIVIALGVIASAAAAERSPDKPLIATAVIDPDIQGFPLTEDGTSGLENLRYIATNVDMLTELNRFQKSTDARHIGIVIEEHITVAIPEIRGRLNGITRLADFKVSVLYQGQTGIDEFVSGIAEDIDALFILPQSRLTVNEQKSLASSLNARKVPTFTTMGRFAVRNGYLMGTALIPSPQQLARQLAVDVRDLSLGRPAGDMLVAMDVKDRLTLNMATARAINYEPPFAILFEAELLNNQSEDGQVLSLSDAVSLSLDQNLSLEIVAEDLRSATQDRKIARSALLPQLSSNLGVNALDRDLAGVGPNRSATAGLSLSQSIYSESSHSNYKTRQHLEKSQRLTLEATRLDVIKETAQGYLNVLVAKTNLEIQRDNLKLTRANLERAQNRYDVGSTDRSEVHRFETELGSAQQSVSSAQNTFQQAKNFLNRILRRPIEMPFRTQEPGLTDPKIFGDQRLTDFLNSPGRVRAFRNFLAEQALTNAPELASLEAQIAAQQRSLLAAGRKRYVPNVDLVGSVDRVIGTHGAEIPANHNNDWSVGIQLSLPLYQGSGMSAQKSQERIKLRRLQLLHRQTSDSIEANARNAVVQAGSSRMNIAFASASAEAAEKTLTLVTDAYVRGRANYIDLIDAQNSLLVARLSSANALYQHMIDLIALQRSIGFFDFFVSQDEEEAWFDALITYTQTQGTP